jgi:hypothetical protein
VTGPTLVNGTFRDGFGDWRAVREDDAVLRVAAAPKLAGACALELQVSEVHGSRAYLQRDLGFGATDLWATASFYVDSDGVRGSNVPFLRFWNGKDRIFDVYRQNVAGVLWLRTTQDGPKRYTYVRLSRPLELGRWYQIRIHVEPQGGASEVDIWLDGALVYDNDRHVLPASAVTGVSVGSEHLDQAMHLYIDDLSVRAGLQPAAGAAVAAATCQPKACPQ